MVAERELKSTAILRVAFDMGGELLRSARSISYMNTFHGLIGNCLFHAKGRMIRSTSSFGAGHVRALNEAHTTLSGSLSSCIFPYS